MKINCINQSLMNYKYESQKSSNPVFENNIQTSIYNQKGVNLPFCGLFKATNMFEQNCAVLLRKQKDGRCRKFTEFDINDIITSLRNANNPNNMEKFLNDILYALEESQCDKQSFKRIIKLIAGKSDDELYTVLAFADHELKNAAEPLKAFLELSTEKREKLMPLLERISAVDTSEETSSALYDTFRTLVYAYDDMPKLNGNSLNKYKIDTCNMLKDNIGYFENKSDEKAITIAKDIYRYFTDNMI